MTRRIPLVENKRRRKTAAPVKHTSNRRPLINQFASKSKPRKTPDPKGASDLESDLFRTLMENTTDRIYFKDAESRFILINRSVAIELGLSDPSEAVGKTDFDFFSAVHAQQAFADEQQMIAGGQPKEGIEEKETWPDGHETWVSTTKVPMRNRMGRIIGTFGISRDITEHKQGEEARIAARVLNESNITLEKTNAALQMEITERRRAEQALAHERDLFRTMMDNTTDRIYFKDKQSRFLLVNRAQAKMFGLNDPAEAVGKSDFDFFTENHARSAYNDEQKIISTGEPLVGLEEKETWPDGHETWVSTTKLPLRNSEGRIIGTFGNSRDITERKAIESSILQANEKLETTNTALKAEIAERWRAEQALAYERDLFRTMMDNTSDHIYFKDAESRFLMINKAQATSFGLDDASKAIGKTDFDFFAEEHARQAYNDELQIIASGVPMVGMEEKETWPGGGETWVSTTKVPMRNREQQIIGTLGISRDITERKTMELSVQMANDKLAEMVNWLEGRNREINVLNKMGELLEACRTPEEAYPVISNQMDTLIPVQAGRLFLLNKESGQYSVAASWGEDPNRTETFLPQDCRCIQSGSIHIVNTAAPGLYCPHVRLGAEEEPIYLCIPLKDQGETIGVLHLRNLRDKGAPETRLDLKQELATTAAEHIALALANLSLRETLRVQSIRDALTGLFNRRYLEESLQRELARAQRKAAMLGVIMLDVDDLKQVNDLYGHEAGDTLLAVLGHWLQSNIRAEDISCRYGGDEFILILPDASLESTYQRARQICDGVRLLEIRHHDRSLGSATVSIGVAGFPENGQTRDVLLSAVDEALYKAKEQGRNCVVAAMAKTSPS